jgi:(p)ppGpp synthase/HD superfamily hydrolase
MNKNLKKIHDYLLGTGIKEDRLRRSDESSVYLAMEIMEYAHRNQKRENGEDYANHPARVLENYRNLVGIEPGDFFCMDDELMHKHNVPYKGVQEVCLLHDVVEDTEFTIDDIGEIYKECGFDGFFRAYIEDALKRITHDKTVPYLDYIKVCLKNPISALVKMMDLQDNLRVIDLVELNEENYKRANDYLYYIYIINDIYHFLENVKTYKDEFAKEPKMTMEDLEKRCDKVEVIK